MKRFTDNHLRFTKNLFFGLLTGLVIVYSSLPVATALKKTAFQHFLMSDEAVYAWQAERLCDDFSLITSAEINEFHPPLFPLTLCAGKMLFNRVNSITAYRLTVLGISIIGLIITFILAARVSSLFTGLMCVICLCAHYSFFTYKIFILNDISLMTLCAAFLFTLSYVSSSSPKRTDILVGLSASLIILVKWSGIFVLPFVILYYLFLPGTQSKLNNFKKLLIPASIILTVITVLCINNFLHLKTFFPNLSAITDISGAAHSLKYKPTLISFLLNGLFFYKGPFCVLFITGLIYIWRGTHYFQKFLTVYILITFLNACFLITFDIRYLIYILPATFLVAGIGLEKLLTTFCKKESLCFAAQILCMSILLIGAGHYTSIAQKFFLYKSSMPLNYRKPCAWIKNNMPPNATIITREGRNLRYFLKTNWQKYGGRIVPCPYSQIKFKALIDTIQGPIIFESNILREKAQTDFRPFLDDAESEAFLKKLGFSLKKNFYKKLNVDNGLHVPPGIYPVIKIYEKDAKN